MRYENNKKQKVIVEGIIEDEKGNILISQRYDPEIKEAHLKWDLPGGTNEFGESLKNTLKREILEETGLKVKVLEMLPYCSSGFWKHKAYLLHVLVFCYRCKSISGKLHLKDHKINDLKWVDIKEIQKLDLLPDTNLFIDLFNKSKLV